MTKTFEEIAPLWSGVISENGYPDNLRHQIFRIGNQQLDLSEPAFCIVGEGRGFTASYSWQHDPNFCEICDAASMVFYWLPLFEDLLTDYKKKYFEFFQAPYTFESIKKQWVDHFNEKHLTEVSV